MTSVVIGAALISVAAIGMWLALREARKLGEAEALAEGERAAREVESDMSDDVVKDKDVDDVLDDLDEGKL